MNKVIKSLSVLGMLTSSEAVFSSNNNFQDDQPGVPNVPAAVPQAAVPQQAVVVSQNPQRYIVGHFSSFYSYNSSYNGRVTQNVNQRLLNLMLSDGSIQKVILKPNDNENDILNMASANLAAGLPLTWVGTQAERDRARANLAAGLPIDWVSADRYLQINTAVREFAEQRGKNPREWAVTHYKTTGKNCGFKYK